MFGLSASAPDPALAMAFAVVMGAVMSRLFGERPQAVMTGAALASVRPRPEIVGVKLSVSFTALTALAAFKVSAALVATVGVAAPPALLKLTAFSVFVATRLSTPPPFTLTVLTGAIWPP